MAQIRAAAAYGARHFVHANNAIDWPARTPRAEGWLGTELMGMGIPVICNDIGDTGKIVQQTGTGVLLDAFGENDFGKAIKIMEDGTGICRLCRAGSRDPVKE